MEWTPSSWDSCVGEVADKLSKAAIRNPLFTKVPKIVTDKFMGWEPASWNRCVDDVTLSLMGWEPASWNRCVDDVTLSLHKLAVSDPLVAGSPKSEAHAFMDWGSVDCVNHSIDQLSLALSQSSVCDPLESNESVESVDLVNSVNKVVIDDLMDVDASDAVCERCERTLIIQSVREIEQSDVYMDVDVPEGARFCARCECLMA